MVTWRLEEALQWGADGGRRAVSSSCSCWKQERIAGVLALKQMKCVGRFLGGRPPLFSFGSTTRTCLAFKASGSRCVQQQKGHKESQYVAEGTRTDLDCTPTPTESSLLRSTFGSSAAEGSWSLASCAFAALGAKAIRSGINASGLESKQASRVTQTLKTASR